MTNNGLGRDAPELAEWIDLLDTLSEGETALSSRGLLPSVQTMTLRDLMRADWGDWESQRLWKEAVNKPVYRWLVGRPHYQKALQLLQENVGSDWWLELHFAARIVWAITGYLHNVHRKAPARKLPAEERRKLLKMVEALSAFLEEKGVSTSTTVRDALNAFEAEQKSLLLGKAVRVDKTWREREFVASVCFGLIRAFGWDNRKAILELAGLVDYGVTESIDEIRSTVRQARRSESVRKLALALEPRNR